MENDKLILDSEKNDSAMVAIIGPYMPGLKYEGMLEYYQNWRNYDEDLNPERYRGPQFAAEALAAEVPEEKRAAFEILDVGAGTGYVAYQLKQRGFHNIDALEPVEPMLEEAKTRGLYQRFYQMGFGTDPVDIPDDMYDAIVSSGTFGENHIPCEALTDMIRVIKPGGYLAFAMRHKFLIQAPEYCNRLEPFMAKLEKAGAWKLVKREIRKNYVGEHDGSVFTFVITTKGTIDVSLEEIEH